MTLVREALAEHPELPPDLHEDRLTAALARLSTLPPEVLRSLFEGLVERTAFFARIVEPEATPVFDRIVAQWLANVTLFWKRLADDRRAIDRVFGLEGASVVDARTNLGDAHDGGHTVSRVAFSDGTFLIYKPRPVRLERFFSEVLARVSTPELSFEGLRVLSRDAYGWVLGVTRRACESDAGVRRFHERLGGLLAIAHAFGATDLHEDNLIAHGEHPILLDLETLISPLRAHDGDALADSVFDSGFLPSWDVDPVRLSGGIGGGLFDAPVSDNVPRVGDAPAAPFDFVDEVQRGFEATWQKLCADKRALVSLAATIEDATYRVVLRPTRAYWSALTAGLADTTTPLRIALARALGARPELAAELARLEVLDIPSFVGTVSSTTVRAVNGDPVAELGESPWDTLTARLAALQPETGPAQCALIGAAFATAEPRPSARRVSARAPNPKTPLDAARAIAEQLMLLAVATRQGGLDWLAPSRHERGFARLGRVDPGLASGRAGITTFFAAMARATGESRYRDVVRRSLTWQAPLREALSRRHDNEPPRLASGGGVGVGSLVYALAIAGQLLDDASLIDDALAWSAWVPEPRAGDALDVMTGHAGNLLALLALAAVVGDEALVARAARLGEYVLASTDDTIPAGFAYGADGIAYALAKLGRPVAGSSAAPTFSEEHGPLGFCHGAAGRALAGARVLDLDDEAADVAHDFLCCGNAGLIDVQLELGQVASSRARAARLLARTAYHVPIAPSCPRPGLFDGLAGIGYMWLRQFDPELPCVLVHATLGRR